MPRTPRTEHELQRDRQRDNERRAEREKDRLIVPLTQRRDDDWIVDHVAIDLALRGWSQHAAALSATELRAAIVEGVRRGLGTPALADLLLLREREVERFRARLRTREAAVAA